MPTVKELNRFSAGGDLALNIQISFVSRSIKRSTPPAPEKSFLVWT